jgi:hypothetical protein
VQRSARTRAWIVEPRVFLQFVEEPKSCRQLNIRSGLTVAPLYFQ